jgi:hypothetical protein
MKGVNIFISRAKNYSDSKLVNKKSPFWTISANGFSGRKDDEKMKWLLIWRNAGIRSRSDLRGIEQKG